MSSWVGAPAASGAPTGSRGMRVVAGGREMVVGDDENGDDVDHGDVDSEGDGDLGDGGVK